MPRAGTTGFPDADASREVALAAELTADGELVTEALDEWSIRAPLRVFAHYGEHGLDLTYAEARRATDTIAGNLAAIGIGRGDRVAVHCRSPYAAALWMLGIWKAGAVFCPVDPQLPAEALAQQMHTLGPALVVTERAQLGVLAGARPYLSTPLQITVHDALSVWPVHGHDELPYPRFLARAVPPALVLSPDDTAMIVHTAGTSGRPKAVVLCHRSVAQYTWLPRRVTGADDVVYSDLPMHTAAGALGGVVRAAWSGATVVLWDRFDPADFWRRINVSGATVAMLGESAVPWLTSAPERHDDAENPLNQVWLTPLPFAHREFALRFGVELVVTGYAQIESGLPLAAVVVELPPGAGTPRHLRRGIAHESVRALCQRHGIPLVPGDAITRKGCLGGPLPFLRTAVLDERDRHCPPGVVGELAIRPHLPNTVMREYLGDPESTAEALRNLWLHTGDAVVTDPATGLVHFVDRVADRIRVRGENVSAYHIEDLVNQHPDVAVCTVFGVPVEGQADDDIVLYVEPERGRYLDPEAVQTWCVQSLPAYMRPRHVRVVLHMPRTANGRVEKLRLRRHFLGQSDRGETILEQRTRPTYVPQPRAGLPSGAPRAALPPALPPAQPST